MDNFFNLNFEFNQNTVDRIIQAHIMSGGKGFVCVIDGNIVSVAYHDLIYRNIVNSSLVNICDGSYIALFYGLLKRITTKPYIGGDLFLKFIRMRKYKQVFLGATPVVLAALKTHLQIIDPGISNMHFMPLPFLNNVEDFEYKKIAAEVNLLKPDIIWISLGAPKQEKFMHHLLPHLDQGVMLGIGAVFDFHSGIDKLKRAPRIILIMKLEWLYRLFKEPQKQWAKNKAFLTALPMLIFSEFTKK